MEESARKADSWSFRPALLCVAVVSVVELICQLPGTISFFLIPLSLLAYGLAALVALGVAASWFCKKQLRKGASTLLVSLLPVVLWWPINRVTDVVHIGLTTGLGFGQLGKTEPTDDGKFTVYDWSVGLAGANRFLIYDGTDQIALPTAQHTQPLGLEKGFAEECAGNVNRVVGHYYICSF